MIEWLLEWLERGLHLDLPAVFYYTSTKMILAAITSLVMSIFFGPFFIRKLFELKIGQSIRTDECPMLGELHAKKKDTPTMGGILILASMLVSMMLWMDLQHVFTLILFLSTVVFGFLGGWDDYLKLKYRNAKGLPGRVKLLVQVSLAAGVAFYLLVPSFTEVLHLGEWFHPPVVKAEFDEMQRTISMDEYASRLYAPFFKDPIWVLPRFLSFLFIVFVVTAWSNAVNLTDGLDGLAAGCLLMVAMCLAVIAFLSNHVAMAAYLNLLYIEGSGEIAIYLSAFAGACLGFLWYNGFPAQVFMGDTGSLALGGILGMSSVLLKREILLVVVGGVFVIEALSVVLQVGSYKLRNQRRVFLCAPLHHHFEYKGWHEMKVVMRFWIVALLLALIGMASMKFQ